MSDTADMCTCHSVDRVSDAELHEMMLRVDVTRFPGDIEQLWRIERQRYRETLRRIPPAEHSESRLLDLGSSRPWAPFFRILLGYSHLALNTKYPDAFFVEPQLPIHGVDTSSITMPVFDVETDTYPFPDATFDVVLCLELLEHLAIDPMHMMAEINRVLKPGGVFVLSTPNLVRYRNLTNAFLGEHTAGWAPYNGIDNNRHNREYTPGEIERLFEAAGIDPLEITTFGTKSRGWKYDSMTRVIALLTNLVPGGCPHRWRRDTILASGVRSGGVTNRRPEWLYYDSGELTLSVKGKTKESEAEGDRSLSWAEETAEKTGHPECHLLRASSA